MCIRDSSKTVNVPADYPYEDFQDLYLSAWKSGLKGLATYRPNTVLGSVLSVGSQSISQKQAEDKKQPQDFVTGDANRRLTIKTLPAPVLASLRWPNRPHLPEGDVYKRQVEVVCPASQAAVDVSHDISQGDGGQFPAREDVYKRQPSKHARDLHFALG